MEQIRKHGGNIKEVAEIYNLDEKTLLDFSANINPLGPPAIVYDEISKNLDKVRYYPDSRNLELKNNLAQHLTIDSQNITLGNGASELIFLIVNHLRPPNVWIPVPTFSEYEIAARSVGSKIIHLPLKGDNWDHFDLDILANIRQKDLIFLCNPNNPTGQLYSTEFLNKVLRIVSEKKGYLVIDESFLDFIKDFQEISFMKKVNDFPGLIILYSLTKFFAIPGLRLGTLIANESLINVLEKKKDPWNINIFAQIAGTKALKEKKYISDTLAFFQEEKEFLYENLKKIKGLKVFKPSANYIFMKILTPNTSTQLFEAMVKEGIIIRNCNSYPLLGEQYIRVAIKTRKDNLHLLNKLKLILEL